ncbi:unnamed protein product [Auanema sp. JU1783]|nr:unnamed protein product [Auanema sp. JU1783]
MFAIVAAGKLPQQFSQFGETEFLCEVPNIESVNHVVIFMTGTQPFPADFGGSVYIRWPRANAESNWHYLGFISNDKPSAIFKITQLHQCDAKYSNVFGDTAYSGEVGCAQIGIMVETLKTIEGKVTEVETNASQKATMAEFGDRMVRNLVNHVESFTINMPKPDGFADFIPLSAFQQWFNSFSRRFQQNPYFWKTLNNV